MADAERVQAEEGYMLFLTEEEAADIFELLVDEGYTKDAEGMKNFMLDVARDDGEDEAPTPLHAALGNLAKDPKVAQAVARGASFLGDVLSRLAERRKN